MNAAVCSQGDGKAAVTSVNGQPLCVDCFTKLQAVYAQQQDQALHWARHNMAMMNLAAEEMDSISGLRNFSPRVQIPAIPATGPLTLNNFKLDNSVVGAINTGNVQTIDATVTQLRGIGEQNAARALQNFTDAILKEGSLTPTQRNELLEQVAFLSEQVTNVKGRKPSLIRSALEGITRTAGAVSSVAGAWQAAEPIIRAIFGQ
jgi:hypothetical protein